MCTECKNKFSSNWNFGDEVKCPKCKIWLKTEWDYEDCYKGKIWVKVVGVSENQKRYKENITAWVAVDEDGRECIYYEKPIRKENSWDIENNSDIFCDIPCGNIEKLIGRKLTWEDEPVQLLENEKYLKI
jgi:hypothetical protein